MNPYFNFLLNKEHLCTSVDTCSHSLTIAFLNLCLFFMWYQKIIPVYNGVGKIIFSIVY